MTQRDQLIDNLRGLAMIVMILTHATAYFPNDIVSFTLWNWSNFAVPIFLFCSVYLFIKKIWIATGSLYFFFEKNVLVDCLSPIIFSYLFSSRHYFLSHQKKWHLRMFCKVSLLLGVSISIGWCYCFLYWQRFCRFFFGLINRSVRFFGYSFWWH